MLSFCLWTYALIVQIFFNFFNTHPQWQASSFIDLIWGFLQNTQSVNNHHRPHLPKVSPFQTTGRSHEANPPLSVHMHWSVNTATQNLWPESKKNLMYGSKEKHQCWSGSDQCCSHFEFCKEPYITNWCSHIISPATTKPTHDRIKPSCNTITFAQNTMSSPIIMMSKLLASCHCSSSLNASNRWETTNSEPPGPIILKQGFNQYINDRVHLDIYHTCGWNCRKSSRTTISRNIQ